MNRHGMLEAPRCITGRGTKPGCSIPTLCLLERVSIRATSNCQPAPFQVRRRRLRLFHRQDVNFGVRNRLEGAEMRLECEALFQVRFIRHQLFGLCDGPFE